MKHTVRKSLTLIGKDSSIAATSLVKRFSIRPRKLQCEDIGNQSQN